MGNKLVILSMSCNLEEYLFEEQIILNTWGKAIVNGEYENIKLFFFRGGEETRLDEEKHVIFVNEQDDLRGTYNKNIKALEYCLKNFDFDWFVITNTSTVLNIPLINKLVNSDLLDEEKYYGGEFVTPLNMFPFFRGDFILLSKKNILKLKYNEKYYFNDNSIFESFVKIDIYFDKFLNKICQLKTVPNIKNIDIRSIGSNFAIRCKYDNRENSDITSINIVGCYNFLCSDKKEYDLNQLVYEPKYIDTNVGILKIEKVGKFEKI